MAKLIALDDGHGMETAGKRTPYISEIGRFIHENEFNRAVVKYLDAELKRCGFKTLLVAPTDGDTSLGARTALANSKKADAYISVHYDAFDTKFDDYDPEGHSVFIYTGTKNKASGKLADCVAKYLKQGTTQKWRGIKEANFHVLRETNMPAILSENGFMDNKREALLMIEPKFQKEVAVEHAKGICEYFEVKYVAESVPVTKPAPKPEVPADGKTFYRVVTGSHSDRENAEKRIAELKKAGFESFIDVYKK
jgi:N-acetylmuramoyl-L-alanine amidase